MEKNNKPQWLIDAENAINEFEQTKYGSLDDQAFRRSEAARNAGINGGSAGKGKVVSEQGRENMSAAQKGKIRSEETRQKMADAWTGIPKSEETKKKIGDANRGREISEETRQKLSKASKGKTISDEHKQKISNANKGRKKSKKSIEVGTEKRKLIAKDAKEKRIQMIYDTIQFDHWFTIKEVFDTYNIEGNKGKMGIQSLFKYLSKNKSMFESKIEICNIEGMPHRYKVYKKI